MIIFSLFLTSVGSSQESRLCLNPEFEHTVDKYLDYTVPTISVTSLAEHQSDYIILDAREIEEFRVSHIPGAVHIGYDRFDLESVDDIDKDQNIVVYCSIGYRSELANVGLWHGNVGHEFGYLIPCLNSWPLCYP